MFTTVCLFTNGAIIKRKKRLLIQCNKNKLLSSNKKKYNLLDITDAKVTNLLDITDARVTIETTTIER